MSEVNYTPIYVDIIVLLVAGLVVTAYKGRALLQWVLRRLPERYVEQVPPSGTTTPTTVGTFQQLQGRVPEHDIIRIMQTALQLRAEGGGKYSRSEVCRRVYNGATAGRAYNNVKAVLDLAESEHPAIDGND